MTAFNKLQKHVEGVQRSGLSPHFNGFTLLELMISITLFGLIVVVISGALRIGIRAWEKGEKNIEALQTPRISLNLMGRQIASFHSVLIKKKHKGFPLFNGDNKNLEFVSLLSLNPNNRGGTAYVSYRIESKQNGEALFVFEREYARMGPVLEKEKDDPNLWKILIPSADEISFEYLKKEVVTGDFVWMPQWRSESQGVAPAAVKIIMTSVAGFAPIEMIVRLPI